MPHIILLGYKTGDIYTSYGDDLYPEFTSHTDDRVIAIKTHTYTAASTRQFTFKRALVSRDESNALIMSRLKINGGANKPRN